jgi:hypothetical protein
MSLKAACRASPSGQNVPLRLYPKSPQIPLKRAENKPKLFVLNLLDTQLPFLYIQPAPMRILINIQ